MRIIKSSFKLLLVQMQRAYFYYITNYKNIHEIFKKISNS